MIFNGDFLFSSLMHFTQEIVQQLIHLKIKLILLCTVLSLYESKLFSPI